MKSVQLKCYRCGKENDVIDMRYTALNRMICKNCMEKGKTTVANEIILPKKTTNSSFDLKKETKTQPKNEAKEPMIEYICKECHYTFKRKKSAIIKTCPYCNAEESLDVKSGKTADNILKESTGEGY